MAWSFYSDRPVYLQLAERIRKKIISGEYVLGMQIPSVRQLATEAAVNPNTVQRALVELESEGILEVRGTLGRFVTDNESVIETCKENEARALVSAFLKNAEQMSITKDQLIAMIKEERDERT